MYLILIMSSVSHNLKLCSNYFVSSANARHAHHLTFICNLRLTLMKLFALDSYCMLFLLHLVLTCLKWYTVVIIIIFLLTEYIYLISILLIHVSFTNALLVINIRVCRLLQSLHKYLVGVSKHSPNQSNQGYSRFSIYPTVVLSIPQFHASVHSYINQPMNSILIHIMNHACCHYNNFPFNREHISY